MNKSHDGAGSRVEGCCGGLAAYLPPRLFKALSDPKRLSLFVRLAEQREPSTVGQVAEGSEVDLSVVSRHLAILRDAGIIECVKRGKEVWCSVQTATVVRLLRTLADALEACCPEGTRIDHTRGNRSARLAKSPRQSNPSR